MPFSHTILWSNPLKIIAFFSLTMSFLSLWIHRSAWLWGSFFAIAIVSAFQANLITSLSFVPVFLLLFFHWALHRKIVQGTTRLAFCAIVFAISIGLWFHLFPGFYNWKIANQEMISAGGVPYNFWLNFDKPLIGLFILAWSLPLIQTKERLWEVTLKTIPLSIGGVTVMMLLAIYGGVVKWDPKISILFLVWSIENLFLVVVPEESFCRGFVQQEIFQWLRRKNIFPNAGAVILTSLLFVLLHLNWIRSVPFLSLVFIAGLIYGTIYQYTKSIESSIFCHFMLNWIHFVFFTYPALAKIT